MAETKATTCDLCRKPGVATFTVAERGQHDWVIDLCETHVKPMLRFQEHSRPPAGKRRPYRHMGVQAVDASRPPKVKAPKAR